MFWLTKIVLHSSERSGKKRSNVVRILLHFSIPERYERRLRFLRQTVGRIAKAVVIAKRVCAFMSMPAKAKCAEGNTDDMLSPSSVMYSTQLACKYIYIQKKNHKGIIVAIHSKFQKFREHLHKAPSKEQPAKKKTSEMIFEDKSVLSGKIHTDTKIRQTTPKAACPMSGYVPMLGELSMHLFISKPV